MGMVVIEGGVVKQSAISPQHSAIMHIGDASFADDIHRISYGGNHEEEYINTKTGLGTFVSDTANRKITVGSGAGVGTSRYIFAVQRTLTAIPLVLSFQIKGITNGVGNYRTSYLALMDDFTIDDPENANIVGFCHTSTDTWACVVHKTAGSYSIKSIPTPSVNDILTIVVSTVGATFYINNVLMDTVPAANIPTGALSVGISAIGTNAAVNSTRELAVSFRTPGNTTINGWIAPSAGIRNSTGASSILLSASGSTVCTSVDSDLLYPIQAPTASKPAYVKGGLYFDTTLNKLRVGGATDWETVTSV